MDDSGLISKERAVYLKLVLMPFGLLIVLNAIFQFITYSRLNFSSWIYFLVIGSGLGCIYAYATYRIGRVLDFSTEQWVFSIVLFLFCFWGSFAYILVAASRAMKDEQEAEISADT
ncbi:MAG: hypothetical protein JW738_00640 [Actinobacteria bacterium]|nr:hypothetical protein [Actinomycetota bacterium]